MNPFRIMILGAGFSHPAGLPLGRDLLPLVRERADRLGYGGENVIERDLEAFCAYKRRCDGSDANPESVDLEEFIGFLDIEHALRLSGSDTWTEDGNQSQLMVRWLIGSVLQQRTPKDVTRLPAVYRKFVAGLRPNDTIITFNYDVLVERLLEHAGKPYRLYPNRYSAVHAAHSEVESRDEIRVLKLHGSVDWFYRREFDLGREMFQAMKLDGDPRSLIFGQHAKYRVIQLTEGPRPRDDELRRVYKLVDPDEFYENSALGVEAPYLLAPSSSKALYASPLRELWNGLGAFGGFSFGLSVIGFSMPPHDEYLRQLIYRIARNYRHWEPELSLDGMTKSRAVLIDYRNRASEVEDLKRRYAFLDWATTDLYCDGLDDAAVDLIFRGSA